MSSIVCWEEQGEIRCEGEEERARRELEEKLKQFIEAKLRELVEQYEIEVSLDPKTLKGVGRYKRRPKS